MYEAQYQTFDEGGERSAVSERLRALRGELAQRRLDGFIIPRADRHQNEYVAPSEERLAWLTGFTGSAGIAIVLADKAALFVDGRYTVQAPAQTDTKLVRVEPLAEMPPPKWLEANLRSGTKLGYDPWLHTHDAVEKLAASCKKAGAELVAVENNPVDAIWRQRPATPWGKVVVHEARYSGEAASAKLARAQAELSKQRIDTLVLSDPHNVAWLFNIRGSDVAHTPLPLAFAIIPRQGRPSLYLDARKLDNSTRDTLENMSDVREPDVFSRDLQSLKNTTVRLDRTTAAESLSHILENGGAKLDRGDDPVTAMKAVKNKTEIAGMRTAHRRDGAALVRFLAWFDREAPKGKLTEIDAVAALETFRRDTGLLKDVSFPTISGAGPNGAIVHYRVTRKTNRRIKKGELFLIDSGAQYQDGTTDVTRTLAVGKPSAEVRDRFTRVLRGHIAIAGAVFPQGTTGAQLDTLARQPLWEVGLDFDHGTGHGVGSYLSVHEGPARISKLGIVPLKRGMILSNEPGYYKAGAYGIRIENLVLVIAAPKIAKAERNLDAFETLTLAPIDRRLIDKKMLTVKERTWLNTYHARVRKELRPLLDKMARKWLDAATKPI